MKKVLAIILMALVVTTVFVSCDDHKHTYSAEWKSDANSHWHECECGAKKEEAAHTYGEWKTSQESGKVERTCTVCAYVDKADGVVVSSADGLKNALNENATTIYLADNIDLAEAITLNKNVVIDLNGHTILETVAVTYAIEVVANNVTICDSSSDKTGTVKNKDGVNVTNIIGVYGGGVLTVKGGNFVNSYCQGIRMGKYNSDSSLGTSGTLIFHDGKVETKRGCIPVFCSSKVTINGGTFTSEDDGVVLSNGAEAYKDFSYEITINGGTFNGTAHFDGEIACGIYMANTGTVNLNGGTFNITDGIGVMVRCGTLIARKATINITKTEGGLTSGYVGDQKVKVTAGSEIVVHKGSGYPGAEPKVETNNTGYTLKGIDGTAYTQTT